MKRGRFVGLILLQFVHVSREPLAREVRGHGPASLVKGHGLAVRRPAEGDDRPTPAKGGQMWGHQALGAPSLVRSSLERMWQNEPDRSSGISKFFKNPLAVATIETVNRAGQIPAVENRTGGPG